MTPLAILIVGVVLMLLLGLIVLGMSLARAARDDDVPGPRDEDDHR